MKGKYEHTTILFQNSEPWENPSTLGQLETYGSHTQNTAQDAQLCGTVGGH